MKKSEMCRICANLANAINSENLFGRSQQKLLRKIEELTGLQLKYADDLPLLICETCQEQTEQAHDFRERCIRVQQKFTTEKYTNQIEDFMQADDILTETKKVVKEEKKVNIYKQNDDGKAESIDENEDLDSLMPIEELLLKTEETTNTDSEYLDDNIGETEPAEVIKHAVTTTTTTIEISTQHHSGTVPRQRPDKHKETNLHCDKCDRFFLHGHNFKRHMLRHSANKPFQCKLCPKRFFTNEDLNIHLRSHTGEKPYPCRYCESNFRSTSSRIVHERSHTNDRPYACNMCEKNYTNSTQLKNHLKSHADMRPYHCETCNVSFNFKKVLASHCSTRMHKLNEEKLANLINPTNTSTSSEDGDWWK